MADGEMAGVVSKEEAIERALEAGLDLVAISPNAEPPVCKVIDYKKFITLLHHFIQKRAEWSTI